MKDEVIAALWKTKEDIAREHDYDVERLGAMVRERERAYADRVVALPGDTKAGPFVKNTKLRNPTPPRQPAAHNSGFCAASRSLS